ncbi:protein of unknown function [uncultured Woeseiaceae bacterium]|uniref:Uncharacterized protein n=1 Tax=uncultured Woeseiaceae bacterium TaxID=1983305 RepID=A0A7D9H5F9_9GAMM|nr:protein of unknown function [uncultured Woeseiaceae bacterium]
MLLGQSGPPAMSRLRLVRGTARHLALLRCSWSYHPPPPPGVGVGVGVVVGVGVGVAVAVGAGGSGHLYMLVVSGPGSTSGAKPVAIMASTASAICCGLVFGNIA